LVGALGPEVAVIVVVEQLGLQHLDRNWAPDQTQAPFQLVRPHSHRVSRPKAHQGLNFTALEQARLVETPQLSAALLSETGIKVAEGLVEQQNRPVGHDRPGQTNPLLLSAAELPRPLGEQLGTQVN
jgi:hypothetical protein